MTNSIPGKGALQLPTFVPLAHFLIPNLFLNTKHTSHLHQSKTTKHLQ